MVFWFIAAAVAAAIVAAVKKDEKGSNSVQIDYSNQKVYDHYEKYVWDSSYNPNNT